MQSFDPSDPVIQLSDLAGKTIDKVEQGYINGFSSVRLHFIDGVVLTIKSDGILVDDLEIITDKVTPPASPYDQGDGRVWLPLTVEQKRFLEEHERLHRLFTQGDKP